MDRLAYLAMSSAKQDRMMEASLTNNLANANTIGFKADRVSFKSLYLNGSAEQTRVYGQVGHNGVDAKEGSLETTGQPLDIALSNNAWLSVTRSNGEKGFVHSASLRVNSSGVLETQNGDTVNGENGFSITVPVGDQVSIDKNGSVSVIQDGQPNVIDKLKLMSLPEQHLSKTASGLISVDKKHASEIIPVEGSPVIPGALERSNVSSVDTLVRMMELSRQYDSDVNAITTSKKNDSNANNLLDVR